MTKHLRGLSCIAATLGIAAALFASGAPAEASPVMVQTPACGVSATTIALGVSPTNGNIVTGIGINNGGFPGMIDSNSVAYTNETQATAVSGAQTAWAAILDKVVSASPTGTYTFSQSGVNCAYAISGSSLPATYANNSTLSSTGTLVATIAGVKLGDILICGVWGGNGSTTSVSISNGTYASDEAQFSQFFIGHATATSTASTNCTATVTATFGAIVVFADYTAAANGAVGNGAYVAGAIGNGQPGSGAIGNGKYGSGAQGNGY